MIKKRIFVFIALMLGLMFSACMPSQVQAQTSKELSDEFPLHFSAVLPGANCQQQYQLDLFENKTFFIRSACVKDGVVGKNNDDIGRWYVDKKDRVVLNATKKRAMYFQVIDSKTVELMDSKGNKIQSDMNYKLKESKTIPTLEPKLSMSGVYSYMADAAIFYECATGLKFPVAFEEDNLALEKAYLNSGAAPGQMLKAELNVKISQRKLVDRQTKGSTLVVEKFIDLIPKELCQNPYSKAKLQNTYWKLTRINSKPVALTKSNAREAHMILGNTEIKGHSGCNRFNGKIDIKGNKISAVGPMMMTRMFCKGSVENEFMSVLQGMHSYKLEGEYLEVFNEDSKSLARFESVYLH